MKGFLQFACTGGKVILAPCNFGNLLQGGLVYLQAEIARAGLQFELDTAALMLGLPIPPEWDGVPVYEAFGLPVERQSAPCE